MYYNVNEAVTNVRKEQNIQTLIDDVLLELYGIPEGLNTSDINKVRSECIDQLFRSADAEKRAINR